MRLLLTADPIGGVWDYTASLVTALAAEGHPVLLAVIGYPTDEQVAQLPEEITLDCAGDRLEWMDGSGPDVRRTGERLARLTSQWGANVVHLNQMAYTGVARFAAPTVVVVHSDVYSWFQEVTGSPAPADWRPYFELVVAGLRAADVVVAPSSYQAESAYRHYRVPIEQVAHNGAEIPVGKFEDRKAPLLLTAGRAWDRAKGIEVLDEAVSLLGTGAPPAHLLGPLRSPDGSGSTFPHLHCHGRVSSAELDGWMRRATIYVAPSLYEPFGLAPLEAALRGCALLLSDIGSFRELWEGCAIFFRKGDAAALAREAAELAGDPGRVATLAALARERALTRYTLDRFVSRYLELYRALPEGSHSRARPVSALVRPPAAAS